MTIEKSYYKLLLDKINAKKKVKIGFIGGSITQGARSTTLENNYAYNVYSWFKEKFPETDFEYINAGVGGTSSLFGVARAEKDLLHFQPDFVVIDFSVNDENEEFFQETFEGLVRRIMKVESNPAICVLNNVFYNTGVTTEDLHNEVTTNYGIPFVSMRDTLYKRALEGKLIVEDITDDYLHPNDLGHRLVADEIIKVLEEVFASCEGYEIKGVANKAPITKNSFENCDICINKNSTPVLEGFIADKTPVMFFADHFKNGWIGEKNGYKITFEIESTFLAIQYRKTINKPSPKAKVIIDNKEIEIILDGNFTETWGDCLYLENIFENQEKKLRKIEIEIFDASEEDKNPFYLLSIISA